MFYKSQGSYGPGDQPSVQLGRPGKQKLSHVFITGNVAQGICHTGGMEEPRRQCSEADLEISRGGSHSDLKLEKHKRRRFPGAQCGLESGGPAQ